MMNGKISVIIPVYEAENYILRSVTSVLCQTYDNLEIILIDDGSRDNSFNICLQLEQYDSRIRLYHQENRGVAAARNKGIEYSKGEYIFFLDSDDWIENITLYELVNSIKKFETELCICGFCYETDGRSKKCDIDVEFPMQQKEFREKYFWELYENAILFNVGTKLYKNDIIKKNNIRFQENMSVYEDICFFLDYLSHTKNLSFCKESFYHYFQGNSKSITHNYRSGFWIDTVSYYNKLEAVSEQRTDELNKALLICLYRAFLQESHNPRLDKKIFLYTMQNYCFPLAEKIKYKQRWLSTLTLDERIFGIAVSKHWISILWIISKIIAKRDNE